MQKRKKVWRGIVNIASLALCIVLGFRSQMVAYAYTEEEKEAAKQWLVQHGYSPDRGGANQAYQDYLNGKFDDEDPNNGDAPNNQDGSETPNNNNQNGSETPNGNNSQNGSGTPNNNNQNGSETPNDNNNQNGTQVPDDRNNEGSSQTPDGQVVDGEQNGDESGTSQNDEEKTKNNSKNGKNAKDTKDTKDAKDNKNQKQDENTDNYGDNKSPDNGQDGSTSPDLVQEQKGTDFTNDGQNISESGSLTSDMTTEQEADFMMFVASQLAESNQAANQEERARREAELYAQSLPDNNAVSANGSAENQNNESKDATTHSEVEVDNQSEPFYIWVIVSAVAVLVLGGVCFWVLRKR